MAFILSKKASTATDASHVLTLILYMNNSLFRQLACFDSKKFTLVFTIVRF